MLDPHRALVYTMVIVSAADRDMADAEIQTMQDIVAHLPAFRDFDRSTLPALLNDCIDLLGHENGLDDTMSAIKAGLPAKLRETAYAIACDLVASDGEATQEELRVLEMLQQRLNIDRLTAVALERGARARFQTV